MKKLVHFLVNNTGKFRAFSVQTIFISFLILSKGRKSKQWRVNSVVDTQADKVLLQTP